MTGVTSIKKKLAKFGLSEKQAEIYLLLLQKSELRIQEIVTLVKIPRSSVYEHLRVLENKGLTERAIGEKFIRVRAYPLGSMRHSLEEKIEELQKLTSDLDDLETTLSKLPAIGTLNAVTIRYYKGVAGARQLFWNSLKTTDTVYVMSSFGRSQFVGKKFYMDFVSESFKRKVKDKVIINPTERALGLIKRDKGTPLARTDESSIRVISEDKVHISGDTLIYNNIYAHLYFDAGEINGFEIESKHFAETQRSIFETLWGTAQPLGMLIN
jgi:sugar-specific transcriptional regulator TrmB